MRKFTMLISFYLILNIFLLSLVFINVVLGENTIIVHEGQSIQKAINEAGDGETVYIKKGIHYESSIFINKSINLVGEDPEYTIINGGETSLFVLMINAPNVNISSITVQNTSKTGPPAGIEIYETKNVSIKNVKITNCYIGMLIFNSSHVAIKGNNFTYNYYCGVQMKSNSRSNIIAENNIENNSYGIFISDQTCQYNLIYHNNFINNYNQAQHFGGENFWDNGYPSGGNYWSDYKGVDLCKGVFQNETGSDGIVDIPYPDNFSRWDRYPLKEKFENVKIEWKTYIFNLNFISNSTKVNLTFNQTSKSVTLMIIGPNNTDGFCRLTIPKQLLTCERSDQWNVTSIGGTEISYLIMEDSENTYIYISYKHGTSDIILIKGTIVIPELQVYAIAILTLAATLSIIIVKSIKKQGTD